MNTVKMIIEFLPKINGKFDMSSEARYITIEVDAEDAAAMYDDIPSVFDVDMDAIGYFPCAAYSADRS